MAFGNPRESEHDADKVSFVGQSESFGWLEDGIRGHIFADETNSTIVVAIKGTTAGLVGGSGTTSRRDKINVRFLPPSLVAAL